MPRHRPTHPPEPLLILCGGLSRRMGKPKALLTHQGQSLIARQLHNALPHRPVWLAAAQAHYPHTEGAHYLPDALPGHQGPLSALAPALQRAQQQGHAGVYVITCDTLLAPEAIIALLQTGCRHPAWADGVTMLAEAAQPHPLLSHWPAAQAEALQQHVRAGGRKVMAWVAQQPHQTIAMPPPWRHLSNFNTPADWARALTVWEQTCH